MTNSAKTGERGLNFENVTRFKRLTRIYICQCGWLASGRASPGRFEIEPLRFLD